MRRTVIALLLLVSGTVATAVAEPTKQNPSAQAPQKSHCAVGVVSRLGEMFNVRKVGAEVSVPIEPWHIDDLVVDRIRGALGKRAAVQRIPYRKELVVMRPQLWWSIATSSNMKDSLRKMPAGARCVRYVFVTPARQWNGDYDWLVGLGIFYRGTLFGYHPSTYVHAFITVEVYDGETLARLGVGTSRSTPDVDDAFLPEPPTSAAQNAKLREVIRELVARNLDAMLPKVLLTR